MTRLQDLSLNKNAHLKGRKRFAADLDDLREEGKRDSLIIHGFRVSKVRAGDDEGSLEIIINELASEFSFSATLFVSDTSEYPRSHSCFCYSTDANLPPPLLEKFEDVSKGSSKPLRETLERLLFVTARSLKSPGHSVAASANGHPISEDEDEDEEMESESEGEMDEDFGDFDDFQLPRSDSAEENATKLAFQRDFLDAVASGYRPGHHTLGSGDFCISISIPVITLAQTIPPRALMAWDRRLLSRSQYLTLLITGFRGIYPAVEPNGTYSNTAQRIGVDLTFKVGLSTKYKPGSEQVKATARKHGLIIKDAEDEFQAQAEEAARLQEMELEPDWSDGPENEVIPPEKPVKEEEEEEGRFDGFSLSSSLESLLNQAFLKIVQLRRRFGLGWAGAEVLYAEIERTQMKSDDVFKANANDIFKADKGESMLSLPYDPLAELKQDQPINLPLTAYCYLVRRLLLCTRHCTVCHNKLNTEFEALKPYVCDSKLCAYQYYSLNRGPSLEYEIIHNPQTVDLLISLAYSAAAGGSMDNPLPIGMGLRVPPWVFNKSTVEMAMAPPLNNATPPQEVAVGADGLCEFDELTLVQMRTAIMNLIDTLPAVEEMRKHLQKKVTVGKSKPKLQELDPAIFPAAWLILRWSVASCTAHLEEITSEVEKIENIDPSWKQFRFTVGAPDAEAKFNASVVQAQSTDVNAQMFPVLYAFHGSPLKNWHSIIRHGLWYKTVAHGRAYGDGVYLAKEAMISMGRYSQASGAIWKKSRICPTNCAALAEVVNLPGSFVSQQPFFVIKDTHWIICRYLLVKTAEDASSEAHSIASRIKQAKQKTAPFVRLDPAHLTTSKWKPIGIPDPSFFVESILNLRSSEYVEEEPDEDDMAIFRTVPVPVTNGAPVNIERTNGESVDNKVLSRLENDWKHDPNLIQSVIENLMPPPIEASPSATMAVQRELRTMLREQENASSLKELGWYMPPDLIGDNLFQWIVEMHSFDPDIPIAKDMVNRGVNSIVFEIRFPPSFPIAPPFFRIVSPRFLPFIRGGGGHVTGGGSICMDLLTADGWLPSYSISAVLMQIKLAISNLDPWPARLSEDWNRPYQVREALEGYKRAAATHGWKIPVGLERLVR